MRCHVTDSEVVVAFLPRVRGEVEPASRIAKPEQVAPLRIRFAAELIGLVHPLATTCEA
jgi:hypothetical protein